VCARTCVYLCASCARVNTRMYRYTAFQKNLRVCAGVSVPVCMCVCLSVSQSLCQCLRLFPSSLHGVLQDTTHTHMSTHARTEKFSCSVCDMYVSTEYCSSFTPTTNSLSLSLSIIFFFIFIFFFISFRIFFISYINFIFIILVIFFFVLYSTFSFKVPICLIISPSLLFNCSFLSAWKSSYISIYQSLKSDSLIF
jgi:hypothetical protein